VWEYLFVVVILGNILPLYKWQADRKINARFVRTKSAQRKKLDANEVLQATAITTNGQQRVMAVVKRVINNYSLKITTENSEEITIESLHQFPTLDDLSLFLDEKTILRLADFKPM
jgi:hypothetical protein